MERKFLSSIIIVALSLLLLYPTMGRTLMVNLSIADLVQEAESIIIGEVIGGESRYPEEGTTICTYITIKVIEDLKGNTIGENLVVKYPVEEIDILGQVVCTTPLFDAQDFEKEVLLFLRKVSEKNKEPQYWTVVGGFQGKYSVRKDVVTGERVIISKGKLDSIQYPVGTRIPYAVFRDKVRERIEIYGEKGKKEE